MRRTLPTLVAIGIGDDADPRADREGVVQQPVKGAPVRMHLHAALQRLVVRVVQVGVAAADMRHAQHRLALGPQCGVQRAHVQRIERFVEQVLREGVPVVR